MNFLLQEIIETLKKYDGIADFSQILNYLSKNNKKKSMIDFKLLIKKELINNKEIFFNIDDKKDQWCLVSFINRFFWVSQNRTFHVERKEGYLWAPYMNTKKKEVFHWNTMKDLKKGDVVFSHYKGEIKCISIVRETARENYDRPKEFSKSLPWMNKGRMVKVDYVDIGPLRLTKQIIKGLNNFKTEKNWIFDRNYKHNVVYLLPLNIKAAKFLLQIIRKDQKITIEDIEQFDENKDSSISDLMKNKRKSGQGFGLSYKEKKIIELYAMKKFKDKMLNDNWKIIDVSSRRDKGYDIYLEKGGKKILAEVKGTTGSEEKVILTKNEVIAARKNFPYAALIIVSGVFLDRSKQPPVATLGKITEIYNWRINNQHLEPINYYYRIK
tara:strand:- start:604 stop:1752 length:1149 start_codon:yes stop_codon:yes gene_type:complete